MKELIGPYRVLEVLGRGGMGVVYRGVHDNLNRVVAVKALAPELTQHPQFRERFFSEARTQAQLQHQNIVTIYDLLEEGGEYFIVMEFVSGKGLEEILAERGGQGLAENEALNIFSQILAALDNAHSQGVIHRDVKASNVLIGDRSQVKLMDFGIALLIGDKRLTQSSQTIGTPVYMSPEQILRPREVDHRSDIYSAGVLLYEMFSGRPPFDAETEYEIKKQHIEMAPVDITSLASGITSGLSAILGKALAKNPDDRFPSAGEFLRAIKAAAPQTFAADTVPMAVPMTNVSPTPQPMAGPSTFSGEVSTASTPAGGSRIPWGILAAGAAALIFIVVAVFLVARALVSSEDPTSDRLAAAELAASSEESPSETSRRLGGSTPSSSTILPTNLELKPRAETERNQTLAPTSTVKPVPPPPPRPRLSDEDIRKKTAEQIRASIRAGVVEANLSLERGEFEAAQSRVKGLLGRANRYRGELVDEVVELTLLEERITDALVNSQVRQKEKAARRAAWERRIQEIQHLVDGKKYPEAKNIALRLLAEDEVPADIFQQAQGLIEVADQELKNIFANTQVKGGAAGVQNETKRDRRRREKEEKKEGGGGSMEK